MAQSNSNQWPPKGQMKMRRLAIAALAILVGLTASGCLFSRPQPRPSAGEAALVGTLTYGDWAHLVEASVQLNGPRQVSTMTNEAGHFEFLSLSKGVYDVTVSVVAASQTRRVSLDGIEEARWRFPLPEHFDRDRFRALANIRPWVADGKNGVIRWHRDMPTRRWRLDRTVRVYFESDPTAGCQFAWTSMAMSELGEWSDRLAGRIAFERTLNPNSAHLFGFCVPSGELGNGVVGYAVTWRGYDLDFDPDFDDVGGHLPRDSVYTELGAFFVVAGYSGERPLIAHELAHVMGMGHVNDPGSLLYPYLTPNSPSKLSPQEVEYAQALYSIGSGVIVPPTGSVFQQKAIVGSTLAGGARALEIDKTGAVNLVDDARTPPHHRLRTLLPSSPGKQSQAPLSH